MPAPGVIFNIPPDIFRDKVHNPVEAWKAVTLVRVYIVVNVPATAPAILRN